jgi:hypothetical protein
MSLSGMGWAWAGMCLDLAGHVPVWEWAVLGIGWANDGLAWS